MIAIIIILIILMGFFMQLLSIFLDEKEVSPIVDKIISILMVTFITALLIYLVIMLNNTIKC